MRRPTENSPSIAVLRSKESSDVHNYRMLPNNKAKVISYKAYGFRTADHFICNLYHCMGNLTAPSLMHRFV